MASHFTLPGKVYFTAIGPGPAKRLTLRTLELLRRADLVVHDDRVPEDVLELIPPHVAVVRTGNNTEPNGRPHEEIQRRMAEAAKNGQSVLRLIFEAIPSDPGARREITTLRQAGIEAEIVPGTTLAPVSGSFEAISLDLEPSSEISAG